jgi:hypothetical protein
MKFNFKMCITNIYISWFFEYSIAILTHQEINGAYRPERQIAPLSPIMSFSSLHLLKKQLTSSAAYTVAAESFYTSSSKIRLFTVYWRMVLAYGSGWATLFAQSSQFLPPTPFPSDNDLLARLN